MSRKSGKLTGKLTLGFDDGPKLDTHEQEIDRLERLHNVLKEEPEDTPITFNTKRDFKKIFKL